MSHWMIWFVLAGVLVILELATGTFYLLMIALGAAAGGVAALAGTTVLMQCLLAAVIAISASLVLRRSRFGRPQSRDAARDPNVNIDIGQSVTVAHWNLTPGGLPEARVMYRGAMWDILLPADPPEPGQFVIREVRGNRLVVSKP